MGHVPKRQVLLLIGDVVLVVAAFYIAYLVRLGKPVHVLDVYTGASVFSLIVLLGALYIFNLYDYREHFSDLRFIPRLFFAVGSFTVIAMAFFYFGGRWQFGRGAFVIAVGLILPEIAGWRILYDRIARIRLRPKRIMILGAGRCGKTISNILEKHRQLFQVVGFLDDNPELHGRKASEHKVLGPTTDIVRHYEGGIIDSMVVAISGGKTEELWRAVLKCKMAGATVYDMPTLYESLTGQIPVSHIGDAWLVSSDGYELVHDRIVQRVKRLMDIGAAIFGLAASLPVCLLSVIAIKVETGGRVLYRQVRVGKGGKHLQLLKFRSMVENAEENCGAVWAKEGDPRVTRVGRIIRRLRIDEIPQMWNVLKGEMSFIGPRPERPEFVEKLSKQIPYYDLRHAVRPGITGWAQVNYGYGASVGDAKEKLEYDLYYIRHMSLPMDCHILLRTMRIVLFRQGSR